MIGLNCNDENLENEIELRYFIIFYALVSYLVIIVTDPLFHYGNVYRLDCLYPNIFNVKVYRDG